MNNFKICISCGNKFFKKPSNSLKYWDKKTFCSSLCFGKSLKGKPGKLLGIKRKLTKEHIEKIAKANIVKGFNRRAEKHENWHGYRYKIKSGYIVVWNTQHPRSKKYHNRLPEHILVAERKIGRFLLDKEVVHHINGIKDDNRPDNLVVCSTQREHNAYHRDYLRYDLMNIPKCLTIGEKIFIFNKGIYITKECKRCGKLFRTKNEKKQKYCGHSCGILMGRFKK